MESFFFLPLQIEMLAKRTKCNKAFVMNAYNSWTRIRDFRFRQNDTQLYSCITISCMDNSLKVFFLLHNQKLVHWVLITFML